MSTQANPAAATPSAGDPLVVSRSIPLANGDRMTRDEFERRWEAMPELKNAELIEGVVRMAAAVRADQHGRPHSDLMGWLAVYRAYTPGVDLLDNTSTRLDLNNMPQPDALLRIDERCGGRSKITPDGYLEGPPELVAEVSASSTSIDLHDKMHVYRRHGVKEYVVWRVLEQALDWFVLRGGNYEQVATPSDSIYRSEVFPGLWLDSKALLGGDGKQVLAVLQQGLDSAEHAAFAEQLERSGK